MTRFEEEGGRLDWPDWAKGIGIVLVVVGHVWRGLWNAGIPIGPQTFRIVDTAIYNFHMPLFFFVSGLFFSRQMRRAGLERFMRSRVTGLLWPLAVWTWIFFAAKAVIGKLANHPESWSHFPIIPLPPREEFWFLWALFLVQAVFALFWRWSGRSVPGLLSVLTVSVILYVLRPGVSSLGIWLTGAYDYAPFLLLGGLYARVAPPVASVEPLLLWVGVFTVAEVLAVTFPGHGMLLRLLFGVLAVVGFVRLLDCLSARWLGWTAESAAYLGKASLTIYVGHVFFAASIRIALLKLGVGSLGLHLLAGVLAGLFMPLAMALILRRVGASRALGLHFP